VSVHVFVGPTLPADRVLATRPDATLHPPVAHGDLLRLDLGPGDIAVVIDGFYHQHAAIRHKEILAVLAGGARVIGCSSMGALRAAELHRYGMVGHGVVFGLYRDGAVNGDDEVAVIHSESPPYRVLSEPLINIRHAAAAAIDRGALTLWQGDTVVSITASLHYTRRVWPAIEAAALDADARCAVTAFRAFLDAHPEVRDVKADDAVDTLSRLDELAAAAVRRPMDWVRSPDWRSRYLHDWEASFAGDIVAGTRVSPAMVARYQQVHYPAFPDRWRSFTLSRIAGTAPAADPDIDLAAQALEVADGYGISAAALTADQVRYWLTREELDRLPERERLLLVLTRSYRMPRMGTDLVEAAADLVDDPAARTAVTESAVINAEVAAKRPELGVNRIKAAVLRTQLARIWQVSGDPEALLAAARDRGLEDVDTATAALRPFFLQQKFRSAVPAKQVTT